MGDWVRIERRILFLSARADVIRRQLNSEHLSLQDCLPLRDDVSTDEITPTTVMTTYDERLGRYVYVGFAAEGLLSIGPDAIKTGCFAVTVAGKRYGKGSSRESSPLAEKSAGLRLIVAESFERIYRQNCDNLGLLTTTDFSKAAMHCKAWLASPYTVVASGLACHIISFQALKDGTQPRR